MAAPVVSNGSIPNGTANFDSIVAGANGTVVIDSLGGLTNYASSWDRGAYTITSTSGSGRYIDTNYDGAGRMNGESIDIAPAGPNFSGSGLTFTFDTPINAFGLNIGDWGTCCQPSSLYISFDGGAVVLVATSLFYGDNPGYIAGQGFTNFVGAFDTSGTFSKVSFYGDGVGEVLVAGGEIRYATLELGSVGGVPEPATWAMMIIGFGGAGAMLRRRRGVSALVA
ncbi:MAG: PEPxxWA-CTERM sorting domain-containing protein [Pseudomonadota bacterium]